MTCGIITRGQQQAQDDGEGDGEARPESFGQVRKTLEVTDVR